MVELAIRPLHGIVAVLAGRREPGVRDRAGRSVEIGLVTVHTRCSRNVVVAELRVVAVRALPGRHSMCVGQYESSAVVVEGPIQPGRCAMALVAGLREVRLHVVRVSCVLIVLQVTVHARATRDVVIAELRVVAIGALPRRHRVEAGQRKSGRGVVELAICPLHGIVAVLAGRREASVCHRSGRVVEIGLVARYAGSIGDVVVVVDVAIRALPRRDRMHSGQRKGGLRVIEGRGLPCTGGMAGLASLGESARHVIRVGGAVKVF